jgi:hypothetical protein
MLNIGEAITLAEKTYDIETGSGFLEVFRATDDEYRLTVFCGRYDQTLYDLKQLELGEIGRKLVALSDDNHTAQVIADAQMAIRISDGVERLKAENELLREALSANVETLVERFLAWPLPQSVCSDACVTDHNYRHLRTGTNIMTAVEARQMIEHLLADDASLPITPDASVARAKAGETEGNDHV